MTLKSRIQNDFITAMKTKDEVAKAALSGIKAKITEAEKANGNQELTDSEVVKVLNKSIKQREESQKIFEDAGREELAHKEASEAAVLRNYMPTQMTEDQIETAVREIIVELKTTVTNQNALIGKTMGTFNKKYQGQADSTIVKTVIDKVIS
jgi:hypothetical protein